MIHVEILSSLFDRTVGAARSQPCSTVAAGPSGWLGLGTVSSPVPGPTSFMKGAAAVSFLAVMRRSQIGFGPGLAASTFRATRGSSQKHSNHSGSAQHFEALAPDFKTLLPFPFRG